jgi:hypothetical protein
VVSLPPESAFRTRLADIGLIGASTEYYGTTHYLQGPRFEALVPFAHSHRNVILASADPGLFTPHIADSRCLVSIELCPQTDAIEFLGAGNVESPFCPSCDLAVEDWAPLVSAWYDDQDGYQWLCPGCQRGWRPWHLDWRGTNGFGRFAIALWHVHKGEAAPSKALLTALHEVSGTPWTFFYYRL